MGAAEPRLVARSARVEPTNKGRNALAPYGFWTTTSLRKRLDFPVRVALSLRTAVAVSMQARQWFLSLLPAQGRQGLREAAMQRGGGGHRDGRGEIGRASKVGGTDAIPVVRGGTEAAIGIGESVGRNCSDMGKGTGCGCRPFDLKICFVVRIIRPYEPSQVGGGGVCRQSCGGGSRTAGTPVNAPNADEAARKIAAAENKNLGEDRTAIMVIKPLTTNRAGSETISRTGLNLFHFCCFFCRTCLYRVVVRRHFPVHVPLKIMPDSPANHGSWNLPTALQLWSVRNEMNTDAPGTLEKVGAMGYRRIELAGFGNLATPAEVCDAVRSAGLEMVATHVPIEFLRKDLDAVISDTRAIGTRRIVCPILPAACFADEDTCRTAGMEMDEIGLKLRSEGLQFSYHVHGRDEFKKLGGAYAMHRMLDECRPGNVELEIDVLWVAHAGISPADYIREIGPMGTLVHIKDMTPDGKSCDLGTGVLDIPGILHAVRETAAAEAVIIEQEHFTRPPMETASENLRALLEIASGKEP